MLLHLSDPTSPLHESSTSCPTFLFCLNTHKFSLCYPGYRAIHSSMADQPGVTLLS